jgi:ribosomal protein S18 acetylase RimI-like enzyme
MAFEMSPAWEIEPAPPFRCDEALVLLAAGASDDGLTAARAEALKKLLQARGQYPPRLWWARRGRQALAAAMVMESPGRMGMLLHASARAAGVDKEALARTIAAASRDALERGGLAFVQALLAPHEGHDVAAVRASGFELLAVLTYMRLDLAGDVLPAQAGAVGWRSYGEFDERELADLIAATYEGSLDCPRLSGLRSMADVLESHKACGVFRPESWWIAVKEGSSAGCILVNDSASRQTAEVVYMGVVPAHRRQGLGRAMLRRAAADARRHRRSALLLAVDERNLHAKSLYETEGYRQTHRQLAFIMTPSGPRED